MSKMPQIAIPTQALEKLEKVVPAEETVTATQAGKPWSLSQIDIKVL